MKSQQIRRVQKHASPLIILGTRTGKSTVIIYGACFQKSWHRIGRMVLCEIINVCFAIEILLELQWSNLGCSDISLSPYSICLSTLLNLTILVLFKCGLTSSNVEVRPWQHETLDQTMKNSLRYLQMYMAAVHILLASDLNTSARG